MRKIILVICAFVCIAAIPGDPETPYETSGKKSTATWEEAISFYTSLAASSEKVSVVEAGSTDIGKPLHLVIVSGDGTFSAANAKRRDKRVVMINNGIHPGEPCGVDASMMLVRDLISNSNYDQLLANTVLIIVPIYNVGGAHNRRCCSRANQVGPTEQGFRGNAQNLDLNRDFIKMDSKNAQSFAKIFREWDPDVFVDTHTSNGADYPYIMTLLTTQKDKLHPEVSAYMTRQMVPELYKRMKDASFEMCPYVNQVSQTPDSGIADFFDSPRYSTGYTGLYNTIGFTSEAHMLKTFEQRVEATYMLLLSVVKTVHRDRVLIKRARDKAKKDVQSQSTFPIRWKLNTGRKEMLNFKGYTAVTVTSKVTGLPEINYDRSQPWEKEIPHFNVYNEEVSVEKPYAYILPQAYSKVADRMKINGVKLKPLLEDVELELEVYYIDSFGSVNFPYEGHYSHRDVNVRKETKKIQYYAGDWVIITDQVCNRYLVETLEPEAHDSWFVWGFFDGVLMRKEYFSTYVFDKEAERILEEKPELKTELEEMRAADSTFAKSSWRQLDFVYKNSEYYEDTHNRYPVGRLLKSQKLPVSNR